MPLETIQEKYLHITIWDTDRFQENMFLGALHIPLKNIVENHECFEWHDLKNDIKGR